jgi:hypothetical protein
MQKKTMSAFCCILLLFLFFGIGVCDTVEEEIGRFGEEYEALVPPPNSSVNSDYKLTQISLGILYSTRALGQISAQNRDTLEKNEAMLNKLEEIIEQNREIIRLLTIVAKEEE